MNTEEYAKAYDEVRKKIALRFGSNVAEEIFSEFEMSEDEKVRKAIIDFFSEPGRKEYILNGFTIDDIIAWLEKQGEQPRYSIGDVLCDKSCTTLNKDTQPNFEIIDIKDGTYICDKGSFPISQQDEYELVAKKIEPKFHEGEWLCENEPNNYARFIQILEIVNVQGKERYRISRDIHNNEDIVEFDFVEKYYHKFDIKDAKDGDVLASELCDSIILFRGIKDDNIDFYCDYDFSKIDIPGDRFTVNNGQHYGNVEDSKDFYPATKEQRDTLLKAMADAGYTFDFDKKELKKIEKKSQRMVSAEAKEALYDKPDAWSEKDESIALGIEQLCNCASLLNIAPDKIDKIRTWLKSLKDRVQPQPDMVEALRTEYEKGRADAIAEIQNHAWSEEDEDNLNICIEAIEACYKWDSMVDWLKSLKDRYTWKPSDE